MKCDGQYDMSTIKDMIFLSGRDAHEIKTMFIGDMSNIIDTVFMSSNIKNDNHRSYVEH